jgi:hypothetical protein
VKLAMLLIAAGALLWAVNWGYLDFVEWSRDWPLALIVGGLYILARSASRRWHPRQGESRR